MQVGQLFNKLVACLTDDVGKSRDDVRRLYYSECVDALVEALTRGTDTQRQLINEVMTSAICCALNFSIFCCINSGIIYSMFMFILQLIIKHQLQRDPSSLKYMLTSLDRDQNNGAQQSTCETYISCIRV